MLPIIATRIPAGTAMLAILSDDIDARIAAENLTVSLAAVEPGTLMVNGLGDITAVNPAPAPGGVTIPTVDAGTGIITVTAGTTAGTYVVYGRGTGNVLRFAEYFSVTVSPQDNAELKTAVTAGITTWGQTANLNYIITTAVRNMSAIFEDASTFTGDISGWDVSAVTDMSSMFRSARAFNGDISGWDVSAVTNMGKMFGDADTFAGDISGWDVSAVTNMVEMFMSAWAFTGDISGWDVSAVTNMRAMFYNALKFNGDISGWDVSAVTDMSSMFRSAWAFTGNISGWDVSSVMDMSEMFGSSVFNGDISGWDVSSVTDMSGMFNYARVFNGNISGWDVSAVTNMGEMFRRAWAFSQNLEEWKDHWTLDANGKYTGNKTNMFTSSGVTGNLVPSW